MAKISVIVPVYNVEQYLKECLNSIINQTLKDIEIITVDDGSKDESGKILDEYALKDSRIKVIHQKNGGYGKAMNVGLDCAKGEYIGIVEPDDYIKLEMYEKLYQIAKDNDLDFVKSDFYRFKGKGDNIELYYNRLATDDKYYNRVINPNIETKAYNFIMNTWCGIYRRKYIEEFHIRHNETPGASFQDNGFWWQTFLFAQKGYFLNIPYYMNRRDNPNSSVYDKSKVLTVPEEYCWIESIIKKNKKNENLGLFYAREFSAYMAGYNRISNKYKKMYIKRFRHDFMQITKNPYFDLNYFTGEKLKKLNLLLEKPNEFYRKTTGKYSLIHTIFSIKSNNRGSHKIITILGIKVKFKNKENKLK